MWTYVKVMERAGDRYGWGAGKDSGFGDSDVHRYMHNCRGVRSIVDGLWSACYGTVRYRSNLST